MTTITKNDISDLQLASIRIDESLQPRTGGLDENHVRELQDTPESWPPIVVINQDGKYLLVDGFHRYAAAQNLELTTVRVTVAEIPPDGDIHGLAFRLNSQHGKPLTLSDRRTEADRLLRFDASVSNMEIARRTALSPTTIAAIRESLEQSNAIEEFTTRAAADGRSYTVASSDKRQPGQLPEPGLLESTVGVISQVFSPAERTQQRRIAQYFQRLAVALEDGNKLQGWDSAENAAKACQLALGDEKVKALADRLGRMCEDVLGVAVVLGYKVETDW